jgi:hypothetical protein
MGRDILFTYDVFTEWRKIWILLKHKADSVKRVLFTNAARLIIYSEFSTHSRGR